MERTGQEPMELLKEKIQKYISKFDLIVFFATFGLALLVHMYMFTHKFINFDDIRGLYSQSTYLIASGRFLMPTLTRLVGSFSSSWIHGILGCIFLAMGSVFVIRIFKIKHYIPALLCSLCLVSFPTIASIYSYMFCAYQYLFALSITIVGAYLIRTEKILPILIGAILIALAMGCYQANYGMATTLLVLVLVFDICEGRFMEKPQSFVGVVLKYLAGLALGMIFYFVMVKISLLVTGTELTTYQGISSMGKITVPQLFERIKQAYKAFFDFPKQQRLSIPFSYARFSKVAWISWGLDLLVIITAVIGKKIYKNWANFLYLFLLLAIIPLAICIIYVMAGDSNVYDLMTYPLVMSVVMPAILADRVKIKKYPKIAVSFTLILLLCQFYFAYDFILATNRAYYLMDMTYENTYAYFVKMTTRIESFEGWNKDCKVALIGTATSDAGVPAYEVTNMGGITTGNNALNIYTRLEYLELFINSKYQYVDKSMCNKIQSSEQYQSMPRYPAEGSIAMIDDILVVKLSD